MLFNSYTFFIFLVGVFFIYWFPLKNSLKFQNLFIFLASYFFYGWWNWRFVFLLMLSTLIDFYFGFKVHDATGNKKKMYLKLSVFNNLIVLCIFKYYNFFITEFQTGLQHLGFHFSPYLISAVIPVGISFYTFHGMSYVFDIYRDKCKPINSFVDYAMFVSFFPLLVAGPIERAAHLLPQIQNKRTFNYGQAVSGLRLMLWGMFKKVVIADSLAPIVEKVFDNYTKLPGSTLILGITYFSVQIYCDFSGYTDIALGVSKLFGFELLSNFKFPYFSRDIAEFWRRWHISLSSWFKDYLYFPLGGSKFGKSKTVRNTFIIFLVSGFWHGANWTFIVWGGLHACFFLPLLLMNSNRQYVNTVVASGKMLPTPKEFGQMLLTFVLATFAWIFFRAKSLTQAILFIEGIGRHTFRLPDYWEYSLKYVLPLFVIDWYLRADERNPRVPANKWLRYAIYFVMLILIHTKFDKVSTFIYFQF